VPRAELETIKVELQSKITDLIGKLALSVPRNLADELRTRVAELDGKLSNSKGETDALKEKIAGLESRVAEAERELEAARSRIKELEAAVAKPSAEEKLSEPTAE
jgi:chromosome segregation ATPase